MANKVDPAIQVQGPPANGLISGWRLLYRPLTGTLTTKQVLILASQLTPVSGWNRQGHHVLSTPHRSLNSWQYLSKLNLKILFNIFYDHSLYPQINSHFIDLKQSLLIFGRNENKINSNYIGFNYIKFNLYISSPSTAKFWSKWFVNLSWMHVQRSVLGWFFALQTGHKGRGMPFAREQQTLQPPAIWEIVGITCQPWQPSNCITGLKQDEPWQYRGFWAV